MRASLLFLAAATLAFAQLDNDTITVTASRPAILQPDQVLVAVTVDSAPTASLDDVLALLTGSGVTAANLNSAYSYPLGLPAIQSSHWTFFLNLPWSKLTGTLAALARAQHGVDQNSGFTLSYSVLSAQTSQELQDSQSCAFPALVSDARRQAQAMAAVAGVSVGPIVALFQGSGPQVATPAFAYLAGDFSTVLPARLGLVSYPIASPPVPSTCTLTVQFKLAR